MHEGLRAAERWIRAAVAAWRRLGLDAKVVAGLGAFAWVGLLWNLTIVTVSRDEPVWRLFPGLLGPAYLVAVGALLLQYVARDFRHGDNFRNGDRWRHLALLVLVLVVVPTIVAMVLRATGKPYTFVHDGAIMAEEAARKLLAGQNPYSVDFLDTPLFYWPMANNPALYHFTYFPLLVLLTVPPLALLDHAAGWYDQRVLYLPAFVACLAVAPLLARQARARLAIAAALALNPYLFPWVIEGRNDALVLLFVFLTALALQRGRASLAGVALAVAVSMKLHAVVLIPFVATYLLARARPGTVPAAVRALLPAGVPFAAVTAAVFVPFLAWDAWSFYDDVVLYNVGGSAWSYPIAGIGFSVVLHGLGVIPYRTAEFPFWIFEVTAAIPLAVVTLRRVWRQPLLAHVLGGYALTLLALLFFGRYFQSSYLGYIVAAVTPALLSPERAARRIEIPQPAAASVPSAAAGD